MALRLYTLRELRELMGLSTGFLAMSYGFLRVFPVINWLSFYYFLQYAVIAGISVWVIELVIFSMFWHLNWLNNL